MKTEFVDSETGKMKKTTTANMFKFVNDFIENEQANYKKNKESGLLTFGRYKGQSVEKVAQLDKGLDYLGWVSRQSWMTSEKFPSLYPKIQEALNANDSSDAKKN